MNQKKLDMLQEGWLKGVIAHSVTASGPNGQTLKGLRWQLQVQRPGTGAIETTEWIFAPLPELEAMLRYLSGQIALAKTDPGTSTAQ